MGRGGVHKRNLNLLRELGILLCFYFVEQEHSCCFRCFHELFRGSKVSVPWVRTIFRGYGVLLPRLCPNKINTAIRFPMGAPHQPTRATSPTTVETVFRIVWRFS